MFLFKQKHNEMIVNSRNVRTRAHDALLFTVKRPNNEIYKRNIYYSGAHKLNVLPVVTRKIEKYDVFKTNQKKWLLNTINL